MTRSPIVKLLLTTALALCIVAPANAQIAAGTADGSPAVDRSHGSGNGDAADIIVTARRVEERLQDVPISITVFNQKQLQDRNIVSATDLATYTPSLSATSLFGQDNTSFAIRGFYQDIGTAPSVGVYFADVVAPRGAANGIPSGDGAGPGYYFDLQNIQVLKGPQGTLFGRNTTGGAILFVPQKPTSNFEGYVEGSVGNFGLRRIQAAINVPLGDSFRARIAVDHQIRDGYIYNLPAPRGIGPDRFGNLDYTSVRASFVADLTPNLENYTIISYTHSSNNGTFEKLGLADPAYALGALGFLQLNGSGPFAPTQGKGFYDASQDLRNPISRIDQWQVLNTTTWRASDTITIKNIMSYAQFSQKYASAIFGTNFFPPEIAASLPGGMGPNFAASNPVPGGLTADQSTFTEEFQVQGRSADDRLTYQGGAYVEISNPLSQVGAQSPVTGACTDLAHLQCIDILGAGGANTLPDGFTIPATPAASVNYTAGETKFRDYGIYAQASYKLSEKLKITGGIRYTWDKELNTSQQMIYSGFPPFLANVTTPVTDPNTGITYNLNGSAPARAFAPGGPGYVTCTYGDASNAAAINDPANASTSVARLNLATDCRRSLTQKSSAPTWLIGLDYTPSDGLLLYAKYSRGYRSGTIAQDIVAPFNIVRPERVDAYEIGFKSSLHNPVRATFNVAGFYNDLRNQQIQLTFSPIPGGVPVSPTSSPVNVNKTRIWGIEVESSITPFTGLTFNASYSYLNTKIQQIPTTIANGQDLPPYRLSGVPFAGDPLPLSPKNKFTINGNYTLPIDENIGRITLGASFTYVGSQLANYNDRNYTGCSARDIDGNGQINTSCSGPSDPVTVAAIRNSAHLASYHLLDLNASWASVGGFPVDLSLFVTNVTDEKYVIYTPGLAAGAGVEVFALGLPRMYGGRLRYHF